MQVTCYNNDGIISQLCTVPKYLIEFTLKVNLCRHDNPPLVVYHSGPPEYLP